MEMQLPKGTRDFLPEEKIARDKIVRLLKETFELYGYNPVETPALEMYETLASKYAGGDEILKEIYTLKDNAERKLGLRYDLTVPLARLVAMNPMIKKPFKRYQIDRVWRDGPIKLGRYREFWQCDADVIGLKSMMADAELIALAADFFKKIELDVVIYVNNRKLMNSILEAANVQKEKQDDAILSIDKLKKFGINIVKRELEERGVDDEAIEKVLGMTCIKEKNDEMMLERLSKIVKNKEGIDELKEVLENCKKFGLKNVMLDISLARGLSYYTGTVFEVFMRDEKIISSSLAAGGRYDKMIGNFMESKEEMPAVGISFGLDTIGDAAKMMNKLRQDKSVVDAYIIPIKTTNECIEILNRFRKKKINTDMDFAGKGITKNLEYADRLGIRYAVIAGEDELKKNKVKIKDMKSGEEKLAGVDEAVKIVKSGKF